MQYLSLVITDTVKICVPITTNANAFTEYVLVPEGEAVAVFAALFVASAGKVYGIIELLSLLGRTIDTIYLNDGDSDKSGDQQNVDVRNKNGSLSEHCVASLKKITKNGFTQAGKNFLVWWAE